MALLHSAFRPDRSIYWYSQDWWFGKRNVSNERVSLANTFFPHNYGGLKTISGLARKKNEKYWLGIPNIQIGMCLGIKWMRNVCLLGVPRLFDSVPKYESNIIGYLFWFPLPWKLILSAFLLIQRNVLRR